MEANMFMDEDGKQKDRKTTLCMNWLFHDLTLPYLTPSVAEIGDLLESLSEE